jgi:hypothetical protein
MTFFFFVTMVVVGLLFSLSGLFMLLKHCTNHLDEAKTGRIYLMLTVGTFWLLSAGFMVYS